jgi:phage shock protein A
MNNERRKRIADVVSKLEEAKEELDSLRDEEQEAYDNTPESLQESDRGYAMQEAIDNLESACNSVEEAVDTLNGIE